MTLKSDLNRKCCAHQCQAVAIQCQLTWQEVVLKKTLRKEKTDQNTSLDVLFEDAFGPVARAQKKKEIALFLQESSAAIQKLLTKVRNTSPQRKHIEKKWFSSACKKSGKVTLG